MFDLPKYGDGVCLARMAALLDALAVDRAWLQRHSVVVTGSNGKGSTAAFCAGIGKAYGLRTGLFTSPHLYRVNERFQVDGAAIGDDELARLAAGSKPRSPRISGAREPAVRRVRSHVRAGLPVFPGERLRFRGVRGRHRRPLRSGAAGRRRFTCVTSVDYEHVELLGHTLELIASDKSDACAAGGRIVYGENCLNLKPHLLEYNRHRDIAALFVRDQIEIGGETASASGQRFDYHFGQDDFRGLDIGLAGGFQFNNAAIAITLFLLWLRETQPQTKAAPIEAAIRSGLRETRWPGRLEVIDTHPLTVVDVGHTPDGIRQSLAGLQAVHGAQGADDGWILVIGVSADKKADEIVGALAPSFATIICTAAHHKGADALIIAASVRRANPDAIVHVAETIEKAVGLSRYARDIAAYEDICRRRTVPRDRIRNGCRAADGPRI